MARKVFTVGNNLVERYKSLSIVGISMTSICKAGYLATSIDKPIQGCDLFDQLAGKVAAYKSKSLRQLDVLVQVKDDPNIFSLPVFSTYPNGNVSFMCADFLLFLSDTYIKHQFKNAIEILQYRQHGGQKSLEIVREAYKTI